MRNRETKTDSKSLIWWRNALPLWKSSVNYKVEEAEPVHVNKKRQPSSVHLLPHFCLTYFISVWYIICYQSSMYLTPDREFPVQDVASIMPELQPTLATLSKSLQLLQIFIETCCWTITFQINVSFHLWKYKILVSMLVEESLHKMKSKPEF